MEADSVFVSAKTGEGVEDLLDKIAALLPQPNVSVRVLIPYSRGDLVSRIHLAFRIQSVEYQETGTLIEAQVSPALAAELKEFAA
jgi:GTP-binding protein HflX